jgi:hypothetical protein
MDERDRRETAQEIWGLGERSEVTLVGGILNISIKLTDKEQKRLIERAQDGASAIDVRLDGGSEAPVLPLWLTPQRRPTNEQPENAPMPYRARYFYALVRRPLSDGNLIYEGSHIPYRTHHDALAVIKVTDGGEFLFTKRPQGDLTLVETLCAGFETWVRLAFGKHPEREQDQARHYVLQRCGEYLESLKQSST